MEELGGAGEVALGPQGPAMTGNATGPLGDTPLAPHWAEVLCPPQGGGRGEDRHPLLMVEKLRPRWGSERKSQTNKPKPPICTLQRRPAPEEPPFTL